MNLLKKNKLTGFRSGAAAREAMMGGGVGGAVGLADAMKDDSSGNVPDDDKMSHYLKSILGYGTAGAGIGAGFGLKKGLKLKNQAAKAHLKDLLPGIEKELAVGVDPTLMGEARKRVLNQIEQHHPAMDYETFMENLANEKAHAPMVDKKPGFFERRDIKSESGKAKEKFEAGRAEQATNSANQAKADEAMRKVESNLEPAKRSVEDIIKERQIGEPGPKSRPSGTTPLAPGKAGAGFKPLSKDTIPGNAPAAPPVPAPAPENIFQKMHKETTEEINRYLNHLSGGGASILGHAENLQAHKEDIANFARKAHGRQTRSRESLEELNDRINANHSKLFGRQNTPSPANSAAAPAVTAATTPTTANSSQGFQSFGSMLGQLTGKP